MAELIRRDEKFSNGLEVETDSSSDDSGDENKVRGNWTGKMDFLLSCVGYAIGLGNIWRFPYLCYMSGGGAFLIPYCLFLAFCGFPLMFMEASYGQFANQSPITVWRLSPIFKGVGYGMVIISGIVCIYYNIIITWTIYFLFMSLRAVLPWSNCGNDWNTENCVNATRGEDNVTMFANQSISSSYTGVTPNISLINEVPQTNESQVRTASEEFWRRHVLELSDGIEDIGELRWQLVICLAIAWLAVFLCLIKGVKSSGKVVYVTATFPYLVLVILFVRGVTLPGAANGIYFYLVPQWEKLLTFKVWGEAAVQIFYSVGVAWGGIITMASYNRFNNNCYRDAMILPFINAATSIFAGFVIFSVLGFMAHETGVDVDKVVTQGPGLIFVVYPEAVAKLPISPLWAVLFFLMIFTIGLDSQFGMFETMTSAFVDEFPEYLRDKKLLTTGVLCIVEFLLGLPLVTQGGIYLLQIIDWYCATFSLMILSFTECVALAYVYGADRFYKDIELMIGYQPCIWWKICWYVITPVTVLFIWFFSVTQLSPVTYGDYQYPEWAVQFGWFLGSCSLIPLPVCAFIQVMKQKGTLIERIKKAARPAPNWGPATDRNRRKYLDSLSYTTKTSYELPPPYTPEAQILMQEKKE